MIVAFMLGQLVGGCLDKAGALWATKNASLNWALRLWLNDGH